MNEQPGFKFNTRKYIYKAAIGMMFTDALSDMYHSTIIRENNKGDTQRVVDRYLKAFMEGKIPLTKAGLLETLERAVRISMPSRQRRGIIPKWASWARSTSSTTPFPIIMWHNG